ncbi:hypothetical protein [Pseudomonas viridiflava]|uniref:hypothetical protein n=1 Tax=Pseudomonas viridiflava TaxID=33069 RepID=UPI0013CED399|nr:hypothetical protein [Pseudomonas viridiflava]
MQKAIFVFMFVTISGCVSADCVKDCYLGKYGSQDRQHACTMDPQRAGCPINP